MTDKQRIFTTGLALGAVLSSTAIFLVLVHHMDDRIMTATDVLLARDGPDNEWNAFIDRFQALRWGPLIERELEILFIGLAARSSEPVPPRRTR